MIYIKGKKYNYNIEDILENLKNAAKKQNKNYLKDINNMAEYTQVTCPFHKNGRENHPSAQFRNKDGLFYCFSCKKTTNLLAVISHILNTNPTSWLNSNFTLDEFGSREITLNFDTTVKKNKLPIYKDKKILENYRFIHPYMYERKLSFDVIRKFDVGYDKKHNSITFPVKDINGNILDIISRRIDIKKFYIPKGFRVPLYGVYELNRESKKVKINEIYVCEGIIDALTVWSYGKYAVALNGLGSKEQAKLLSDLPYRSLILALDKDENNQGQNARIRLKKLIKNKIIKELNYTSYGDCKDINDMTKEQFLNANITLGGI